jgi:DNA-directed RNA polymerase specialized sigma24 family protein
MISFASRCVRPDDVDDVVGVALSNFCQRVDTCRVERELVSYALYCVRSTLSDRYRARRSRLHPLQENAALESCVDDRLCMTEEVDLGILLEGELDGVHLAMAELLYEGYTVMAASRILGLRYHRAQRIRDEIRVILQPLVNR